MDNRAAPSRATPSHIVRHLDEYVIGQDEAKKILAVAVYVHYRKLSQPEAALTKSNILLIGPSGTGKTLTCDTLSRLIGVPFVTADATSLAQTRYINEEIEAILQRLVEKAGGDVSKAGRGIVFIDEVDKLKAAGGATDRSSGESVQHALLKIMEGAQVRLADGRYIDTTHILFICGGAFVGLDQIREAARGFGFIATSNSDTQSILDRLNQRVKPTDLFQFGLIPEFTGRLPVIANFNDLSREMLKRILVEPRHALYGQFRKILANEGVQLEIGDKVFEQIAELAYEYKTGARSLRGIFEEMMTPVLYALPDAPQVRRVVIDSLFNEPRYLSE